MSATESFDHPSAVADEDARQGAAGVRTTSLMLIVSSLLLALGLVLPIVETKLLGLFAKQHSLLGFGLGLASKGDLLLAVIVLNFSVVLPIAKLATVWRLHAGQLSLNSRRLHLLEAIAKWSMLDVFVVALLIFSVKASGLATALAMPGLWTFAAAIVLGMVASARVVRRIGTAEKEGVVTPVDPDGRVRSSGWVGEAQPGDLGIGARREPLDSTWQVESLTGRARVTIVLCCMYIVFSSYCLLAAASISLDFSLFDAGAWAFVANLDGVLAFSLIIPYLMWMHRAVRNSHVVLGSAATISPWWAVLSCFVPPFLLWMPYRSMMQVAEATTRRPDGAPAVGEGLLLTWWLSGLVSGVILFVSSIAYSDGTGSPTSPLFFAWMTIAYVPYIVSSVLTVLIVRRVDRAFG